MVKAIEYQNDFQESLERLISDPAERLQIMNQVSLYREAKGHFSKTMAASALQTMDPGKSLKFRLSSFFFTRIKEL